MSNLEDHEAEQAAITSRYEAMREPKRPMINQYANQICYSDVLPFEILAVSKGGNRITIRAMMYELDPNWQPEIIPGGFAGHCVNQSEQRWVITSDETARPIKANKRKDGYFYSVWGKHRIEDQPRRFYDYNF